MISNQSLTCPKGTSLTFEIDMDTGSDLTGATAQWALAESWFDQAKVYLTKTGVGDGLFINQDAGIWKITVNLAPSDTLDVPSGLLYHDCKVLLQSGDVEDVANGPFYLDPSVNIFDTNAPITRNLHALQALGRPSQVTTLTVGALARNLLAAQSLGGLGQAATASDAIVWDDSSTVPVVIFTGESNSGGIVPNTGIPTTAHPDVKILNNTSLTFESLQIGVNNLIGHSSLTDNATHGWELEMAAKAAANAWGTSPVYLVKTGQGGSKASDWANPADTALTAFQTRWNAAASAISALGKTPAPVIWMSLGINDAMAPTNVDLFKSQMGSAFFNLRNALGRYAPIIMTKYTPSYSTYSALVDYFEANSIWIYGIDTTAANAFLLNTEHWDEGGMTILADAMTGITVDSTKVGLGSAYAASVSRVTGPATISSTVWDNSAKGTTMSLYNGRQDAQGSGSFTSVRGTTGKSSGKSYFEVKVFGFEGGGVFVGLMDNSTSGGAGLDTFNPTNSGMVRDDGFTANVGFTASGSGGLGTLAAGDVIGCAVDAAAKKMWLSKNNTWLSSGDPVAGTSPYFTWGGSYTVFPSVAMHNPTAQTRLLAGTTTYTPPSGYSVWG